MTFHPKMVSSTEGIFPIGPYHTLADSMAAFDLWHVSCQHGARGSYSSPHPRLVIFLGKGSMTFEHPRTGDQIVSEACFVPAGEHLVGKLCRPGELRHLDLHFQDKYFQQNFGDEAWKDTSLFLANKSALSPIANQIVAECINQKRPVGYTTALATALLHEFTYQAMQQNQAPWLHVLETKVADNIERKFTIDDLGAIVGMSKRQLSRAFANELGISPYRWLIVKRMDTATKLLIEGDSLSAVAAATGFADQAHFTRTFRKAFGVAPGQWRVTNINS
ncbi:MAG: AraC family transcriptional regulator [Pseudomonadota bacterium]